MTAPTPAAPSPRSTRRCEANLLRSFSAIRRDTDPGKHDCGDRARRRQSNPRVGRGHAKPVVPASNDRAPDASSPGLETAAVQAVQRHQHRGFRRDYHLGDVLRSPADVSHATEAQAFQAASALEDYDFAFVKRSDGSFSYAILAYRSTELIRRGDGKARTECLNFVTSDEGATKKVAQGNWSKCVRLPAVDVCLEDCLSPLKHEPPVHTISYVPQMEDEHSVISNVSESASLRRWRRMHTA